MMFRFQKNRVTLEDTKVKYYPLISFVIFAFACLQFIHGEFPLFAVLIFTYMYVDYINLKKLKTNQTKTKTIIVSISVIKLLIIISLFVQKFF